MNILVIDGMGGGIGKAVIEHIKSNLNDATITAVGTNSIATSAMVKAGADYGATGENAVVFNCAKADFIIGVTGIIFANAMHGEISPKMAEAVSSSPAHKILLPIDKCNVTVLGVADKSVQSYITEIVPKLKK
jgi:acyl-coenzyme A synthetase/AMP-(fatty) acid ligase